MTRKYTSLPYTEYVTATGNFDKTRKPITLITDKPSPTVSVFRHNNFFPAFSFNIMKGSMPTLGNYFKILYFIISKNPILMVNHFGWVKFSPDVPLHDKTMFENIPRRSSSINISFCVKCLTTFPRRIFTPSLIFFRHLFSIVFLTPLFTISFKLFITDNTICHSSIPIEYYKFDKKST